MLKFTLTDVALFVAGFLAGILTGWGVGKLVFSQVFRKQQDQITLESSVKFQAIQQVLNYLLGFALGTAVISPQVSLILLVLWLGVQTFLAVKIFGFDSPVHGLTFAFIDTITDLTFGTLFGAGSGTFTLFRLALSI
jgi:hypothetical protein